MRKSVRSLIAVLFIGMLLFSNMVTVFASDPIEIQINKTYKGSGNKSFNLELPSKGKIQLKGARGYSFSLRIWNGNASKEYIFNGDKTKAVVIPALRGGRHRVEVTTDGKYCFKMLYKAYVSKNEITTKRSDNILYVKVNTGINKDAEVYVFSNADKSSYFKVSDNNTPICIELKEKDLQRGYIEGYKHVKFGGIIDSKFRFRLRF